MFLFKQIKNIYMWSCEKLKSIYCFKKMTGLTACVIYVGQICWNKHYLPFKDFVKLEQAFQTQIFCLQVKSVCRFVNRHKFFVMFFDFEPYISVHVLLCKRIWHIISYACYRTSLTSDVTHHVYCVTRGVLLRLTSAVTRSLLLRLFRSFFGVIIKIFCSQQVCAVFVWTN